MAGLSVHVPLILLVPAECPHSFLSARCERTTDGRRTMSSTDAHGSSVRGAQLLGDLAAQDEARQSDSSGKGPDAGGTGQQVAEDSSLGGRRPVMSLFYLELASLLLIPFCQSSRAASRLLVLGLGSWTQGVNTRLPAKLVISLVPVQTFCAIRSSVC